MSGQKCPIREIESRSHPMRTRLKHEEMKMSKRKSKKQIQRCILAFEKRQPGMSFNSSMKLIFQIFPCNVLFTLLRCLGKGQANCQLLILDGSQYSAHCSVSAVNCLFNPGWLMVMRLIGIYKYSNYKFFSIFNVA